MAEYIEREAVLALLKDDREVCADSKAELKYIRADICSIPAADVPPALWTDEPISGTEFMTHNQGQSGFEIHFRTDDKAKYEAVQDECRRQIGHEKPAADGRPVVLCGACELHGHCYTEDVFAFARLAEENRFCAVGKSKTNGVKREES